MRVDCWKQDPSRQLRSSLPGKIKISTEDPRQLQYGNGKWYLQFGDNEYRLLDRKESKWKSCIDQAAQAGFNRIRAWLCPSEDSLLDSDGNRLDLDAWEGVEERLLFALQRHPELQFEISLFGADHDELARYGDGEPNSHRAYATPSNVSGHYRMSIGISPTMCLIATRPWPRQP